MNIGGGVGADGADNAATGDGGAGGDASGTIAIQSAIGTSSALTALNIYGGAGGTGGDASSALAGAGGAGGVTGGGSLTFATGAVHANVDVYGGAAGNGGTSTSHLAGAGGGGGNVTVTDFTPGITGSLTVRGGAGGNGTDAVASTAVGAAGGNGGVALVSDVGAFVGTTTAGGNITVTGGAGGNAGDRATGNAGGAAGTGGNATVTKVESTPDIATMAVTGGAGGDGGLAITGAAGLDGGTAGTAAVTTSGGATLTATTVNVKGGAGGNGGGAASNAAGGAGTAGGTATWINTIATIGGQVIGTDKIAINVTGGAGGNGGAGAGNAGVTGIAGGAAQFTSGGGTTLRANVTLDDGADGTAGTDGAANGGALGAGGVATFLSNAAHTMIGDVTAASNNEGVVATATGALTLTGSIGTSAKNIDQVNLAHGLLISGDLYAVDLTSSHANGDVTFTNTTLQTVSAAIDSAGNDADVITEDNSIVTFKAAIGKDSGGTADIINALTIGATTTTIFESTVNATTATLADAANITVNAAFHTTGTITAANTNTTVITVGSGFTYGDGTTSASSDVITAAGGWVDSTRGANTITLNMPADFNSGHLVVVQAGGNNVTTDELAAFKVTDTAIIDYAVVDGASATYSGTATTQDVVVTATAKTAAATAAELGITEAAASGLSNAALSIASDATLRDLLTTVLATGGATAKAAAEQVQGTPAGLSATSGAATATAGAAVVAVGSSRMAALRTGNAYASASGTGFNAGTAGHSNSLWMKPFASFGDQGERKNIAGYDADTYGLAIGADTRLNAKSVLGVSFSYADTDVDGKGESRAHSDISSYQLTGYADYTERDWYLEALVGYAYNSIDTRRDITFANSQATGDTESNQFMFGVSGGMPMKAGANTYFTPSVGVNVTFIDNQSYTETGAAGLNLRVDPEDITIAKMHVGGRYHATIKDSDGTYVPELRAKLLYDMAGDDGSSSNTFTGGGAAFNVQGLDVVEFATSIGAGLAYTPSFDEGMSISVNYDAELKEDFTGHSANFNLNYTF
jgi:outer membrane autotransporter protein